MATLQESMEQEVGESDPGLDIQNVLLPEIWTSILLQVYYDAIEEHRRYFDSIDYMRMKYYNRDRAARVGVHKCKLFIIPFTLSHICRYFNILVTTNPRFWTNVFVYLGTKAPQNHLDLWLRRSQSQKLSITVEKHRWGMGDFELDIWMNSGCLRDYGQTFKECVLLLEAYSHRWGTISLRLPTLGFLIWERVLTDKAIRAADEDRLPPKINGSIPYTVHVEIKVLDMHWDAITTMYDFLNRMPLSPVSINALTFEGVGHYDDSLDNFSIISTCTTVGTRLTELTLSRLKLRKYGVTPQGSDHLLDLSRLPHLQVLTLFEVGCTTALWGELETDQRVTLGQLHTLRIHSKEMSSSDVMEFFAVVLLPRLEELQIDDEVGYAIETNRFTGRNSRPLEEMVKASGCVIRRLHIVPRPGEPDPWYANHLTEIFSSFVWNSLEILTVHGYVITSGDVFMLDANDQRIVRWTSSSQDCIPFTPAYFTGTLRHLTLTTCMADDGVLAGLATWRMRYGVLRYLYVEVIKPLEKHPEDCRVFHKLREDGYDANIFRSPSKSVEDTEAIFKKVRFSNLDNCLTVITSGPY